jgi:mitochondrial fission process protein 1
MTQLCYLLTRFRAGDSTDTNYRYAAYAARARTILLSAHRYVAYTSDVGESFRPIAHPWLVKGAYGISWAYLIGDVSHEGYKAYCRNQRLLHPSEEAVQQAAGIKSSVSPDQASALAKNVQIPALEDFRAVMVKRAVFQSVASMGLPAFTIHSIVRYSGRAMKNVKNTTLRTWGPIGVGCLHTDASASILTISHILARTSSCSSTPLHVRRACGGSYRMAIL